MRNEQNQACFSNHSYHIYNIIGDFITMVILVIYEKHVILYDLRKVDECSKIYSTIDIKHHDFCDIFVP